MREPGVADVALESARRVARRIAQVEDERLMALGEQAMEATMAEAEITREDWDDVMAYVAVLTMLHREALRITGDLLAADRLFRRAMMAQVEEIAREMRRIAAEERQDG